jgi:hypothetical protein
MRDFDPAYLPPLWVITGIPLPPSIVRFVQLRTSRSIGFAQLCADIVAKVPNRQELIFLLLKKSTDDR